MKAWMIYNIDDYKKNKDYYTMHLEKASKKGIDLQLKYMELFSYGVKNNKYYVEYDNEVIDKPDFVIGRMRSPFFTKHLELMGIDVYNNYVVADICNNKAKTYEFLAETSIDIIDTEFICNNECKYKLEYNNYFREENVIKTCTGHGGTEVYLGNEYKKNTLNKDIVIQPLIKGNKQDVRVYVLDNEIIGAVLRTGKNGFKSNFSLGGDAKLYHLSKEQCDIVTIIINRFKKENYIRNKTAGLFYVGIDFILDDNNKFIFNEIEDVVGSRMLYQVSDIDIVDLYLNKIIGKYTY